MAKRRSLPSLLPPWLKTLLATAVLLALFMVANAGYLLLARLADALNWRFFAVGETSLPKLFQMLVLTHTGVGLLLAALMAGFAATHLPKVWARLHRASVVSGLFYVTAGLGLVVTGLFILTAAASRNNRWAWWVHVICAALVVCGYVAHRLVSYAHPPGKNFLRFGSLAAGALLVLVIGHGFTKREVALTPEAARAFEQGLNTGPGSRARDLSAYAAEQFLPTGFVPPASPFFPSPVTTTSGAYLPSRILTRGDRQLADTVRAETAARGFSTQTPIGATTCERCHQDIVAQWSVSAHRFASFNNPFYEATINLLRDGSRESNAWIDQHIQRFPNDGAEIGRVKSKWCSGCHDPAIMLAGKMVDPIDRGSVEAQAGLTCLACHAIDHIHDRSGNGNYNIADEQEDPYLFADAESGTIKTFLHDAALKAKPTVHKRQMLDPSFRKSEYCATCHKVSLSVPVNNYRWLRGQNEFDNWDDSGISLNAARTFYLPGEARRCQDCHMPLEPATRGDLSAKDGMVRSHRFLAVNTALPFLRGDNTTLSAIERFLQDEKLRVDIFAIQSDGWRAPVMAIDPTPISVMPGDRVTVDVVVRNQNVGHTFPGGTIDSNEGWLEFTLLDETGRMLAQSGAVERSGHLDPMAHVYKGVFLDKHGQPIQKRNAQDIHVGVFSNVIAPGTADLAHYRFIVPPELAGRTLRLRARLLWRKFDRPYTVFAFSANPQGFKLFDAVPNLPITEIASQELSLAVTSGRPQPTTSSPESDPAEWVRYNDYGIGLLLEGDTRRAALAFQRVAELQPTRIDGPLNLARTALQDGNLEKAYEYLVQCEKIESASARAAWVWGRVLQEDGRYDDAVAAYRRVLDDFPRDRATWRHLGRTYYLAERYEQALAALDEVLVIDPEDRTAHYHRMLALRALGRSEEASRAEAAYEYYRIDESAQEVTRAFRLEHPGANLMAQPIRIHDLTVRIDARPSR